jgi:hypothetical protein
MTEILFSSRHDAELLELVWSGLDTWRAQWGRLFDILATLEQEKQALGSLRGEFAVDLGTTDRPEPKKWSVTTAPPGVLTLRAQLEPAARLAKPYELELACEPLVMLPDNTLSVVAYDREDLVDLGEVPLAPIDGTYQRIVGTPPGSSTQLLYLQVGFDISAFAQYITMYVCSQYDVWRPVRFDGEPNTFGDANADILRACFAQVAAATGGQLSGMALRVPPSPAQRR